MSCRNSSAPGYHQKGCWYKSQLQLHSSISLQGDALVASCGTHTNAEQRITKFFNCEPGTFGNRVVVKGTSDKVSSLSVSEISVKGAHVIYSE